MVQILNAESFTIKFFFKLGKSLVTENYLEKWGKKHLTYSELKHYLKKWKLEEYFLRLSEKFRQWSFDSVLKNIFESSEESNSWLLWLTGAKEFWRKVCEEQLKR